jgi:hypothetical protein
VFGAVLAADRRLQRAGALLTLVLAAAFDLLFFFIHELPATVPVALALIVLEVWGWRRRRSRSRSRSPSAASRPSMPAGVTPRRAT